MAKNLRLSKVPLVVVRLCCFVIGLVTPATLWQSLPRSLVRHMQRMAVSSPAPFAEEEEELPGGYLGVGDDRHACLQTLQAWQLRNQGSNVALQLAVQQGTIAIIIKAAHVDHLHVEAACVCFTTTLLESGAAP